MSVSTWLARTQMRHFSFKKVISWYSGLVKGKSPEAPYEHVVQIGDPTLRAVSLEIPSDLVKSPEIKFLIDRMRKVMRKYKCVGLAAPQIGAPFRLFVMEFAEEHLQDFSEKERESREMQIVPFTVKF
jgi:peptide deformylase